METCTLDWAEHMDILVDVDLYPAPMLWHKWSYDLS